MTRCQGTIRLFYSYDAHLVFMYACIKKEGDKKIKNSLNEKVKNIGMV